VTTMQVMMWCLNWMMPHSICKKSRKYVKFKRQSCPSIFFKAKTKKNLEFDEDITGIQAVHWGRPTSGSVWIGGAGITYGRRLGWSYSCC